MKVGMPTMKLDRLSHGKSSGGRAGNVRAICLEAMSERAGSDPDIDRQRTSNNAYFGYKSGHELAGHFEDMAAQAVITDKHGKAKKLRSDAGIAFAGIIKPGDEFRQLTPEQQDAFLSDSLAIVVDIYGSRGMVIDAAVIHNDEGNSHMHYFGHDPEYKLGKKLGLPLYDALNREYPKRMREKGWDVESLTGWKEATAGMTADEKADYKASRPRKRHGKSSEVYKAERDVAALEQHAKAVKQEIAAAEAKQRLVVRTLDSREKAVEAREAAVEAQAQQAAQERQEAAQERQEAAKERRAALAAQYTIKAHAERLDALEADIHALGQAPTAKDAALLDYMKHRKNKDGVSMYDAYTDKAADWQRSRQQQQRHAIQTHRDAVPAGRRLPNIRMPETGDDYEFTR